MKLLGNTHLVAGGPEMIAEVLLLLKERGIATHGNPDIYVRGYQRFGIDEARELRDRASSRALRQAEGGRRIFVIATPSITNEAQNALLKTLEEPPADAMFFFIVPAPQTLLSTLRSRAQILWMSHIHSMDVRHPYTDKAIVDAKKFLAATATARLEMLKPLLEKDEDEKRDLGKIIAFLSALERELEKSPKGLHAARREGIESVYRARKYIGDKGALIKPLLEQVALLVPRT